VDRREIWRGPQGGAVNPGLICFFSSYRPSCLLEAYFRPEKYLLVSAGLKANHLFNFNLIFLSGGGGKRGRSCGSGPLLAGPIPQRRTDIEWPD
jgi:hypothetical protein